MKNKPISKYADYIFLEVCGSIPNTLPNQGNTPIFNKTKAHQQSQKKKTQSPKAKDEDLEMKFIQAIKQLLSTTLRTSLPKISTAFSRYFKNEQSVLSAVTNFSQRVLTEAPQSGETRLNSEQKRN